MDGNVSIKLWSVIVGFVAAELLILVGLHPSNAPKLFGISLPEFRIWWLLLVFQSVFWGFCLCNAILWWWSELRKEYRYRLWVIGIRRTLLVVVIVVSLIFESPFHFPAGLGYEFLNLRGSSFLGFISAAWAVQGIWVTEAALFGPSGTAGISDVRQFVSLRDRLDRFLLLAGAILGLATVSLATLRNLILALAPEHPEAFPSGYVVLFGGLYSVLLTLAYAPAYLAFQWKGAKIRDELLRDWEETCPLTGLRLDEVRATHKSKLENILRLRFREWASIGPGLSVLAPFLISVITRLLSAK